MSAAEPHPQREPYDVLALGASAGGHAAVTAVLQALPPDFALPIVVMLHLSPDTDGTAEMFRRLAPFAVEQVQTGAALAPHTVLLCPPHTFVDVLPDGTFALSPNERGAVDKPIDRLLSSLARSFGHRAIGVILTGMGADGALGARELHGAGGRVIVQHPASAEFPDMPRAAVEAGAADLLVPLADIGEVIADLAAGTPQPQPRSELSAVRRVFGDEGEVAALARTVDWTATELGPVRDWPPALSSVVRLAVDSPYPVALWLGPHATLIANEAALPSLGSLFPAGFAKPYPASAPARYDYYRQSIARAWGGQWVIQEAYAAPLAPEEQGPDAWWNVLFTPIREADGRVIGIHIVWQERTAAVLAARRLQLLNALAAAATADNRRAALASTLAVLQGSPDIPFAAAYLLDAGGSQALLAGTAGTAEGDALAPRQLATDSRWEIWPLQQVLAEGKCVVVAGAAVCPLYDPAAGRAIGVVVLGINGRLEHDEPYQNFLVLVAETIGAKAAAAQARRRENERLERLAELDRTKTEFFANISHEFRTPLTLMLGPLEDLLRHRAELPPALADEVEVAAGSSRRLLRLVNSLLDFSQIETRRQVANFEPTDLGALTGGIASAFRSAIEAAGLRLRVTCSPDLPPVWVDREMWEKIVSNLLSNAFKFTFGGEIDVELHALTLHAELLVRDTGIGIPAEELPDIFKRFHRVRGAQARTVEGSGIGLAIVDDLVKRLGGQLRVRSTVGEGTEFTIWIPYKSPRVKADALPASELPGAPGLPEGHAFAGQLAEEAARWAGVRPQLAPAVLDGLLGPEEGNGEAPLGTILVADDNADMRSYLQRLLGGRWQVELAADGEEALAAALDPSRGAPPDVILADVMMPRLDGFQLTQRVRAAPRLADTPVVLLTARAGEEAAIQGLQAGAGDYIAKPFSPRELLARLQGVYERARTQAALRRSAEEYHTLFDAIDEGFCLIEMIFDAAGAAVDYRFLEANEAFAQRTGLVDPLGKLASELAPGTEQYWLQAYGAVAQTGEPLRLENYHEPTGRWYLGYATRVGGAGSRRVAVVFDDITEHKREARQREYLLRLSDAIRPLSDPLEIQRMAMRLAGEHLQVDCAMYNEIRDGGETIHIADNYVRGGFPKITGDFAVRRFGAAMDVLRRGEILVVEDQRTTPLKTGTEQAASMGLGVLASATVPLVKEGRWVANFGVLHGSPRRFTPDEIAILQETAERTWAAVARARAEAALRASEGRLEAELAERTAQVRELVTRLTMSEQEERRRISSLLHDDVQQRLFSFIFLLAALRQALDAGEDVGARAIIGDIEAGLQEAIRVARELSVDLSPPVLLDEGLAEALRWLASQMKQQHGLRVKVAALPDFPRLGEDLRVLLFQTVRELLFNVVKHAGVQAAAVTLAREGERLLITVRDDGRGFTPAGVAGGQGLRRIEQRMKLLGGGMEVAAAVGKGTCVTLVVPVGYTE